MVYFLVAPSHPTLEQCRRALAVNRIEGLVANDVMALEP